MNTNTYLFLDAENIKYHDDAQINKGDTPQPISKNWPSLPVAFQRHIDDVINLNGYLYFFKGSQYLKFDIKKSQVIEGPKHIIEGWPGLRGTEFENGIDAATEWVDTKRDVVCFFKGRDCIDYTVSSHTISKKTISARWGTTGNYSGFNSNLDAVILWRNIAGYLIYLFKDGNYIRYNTNSNTIDIGPTSTQSGWPGVTFPKIQAAVSVDADLLGSDRGGNSSCGGTCGTNDTGKHCFQLPHSIRFGLTAYNNTNIQQTVKVYIDDLLVDTLIGKGTNNPMATKTYTSGTGKICIAIEGDGKPSKLRYFDNTLDGKPGTAIIGAENGTNNNYNDCVVMLNWPLV
ncbi:MULTISPECIES: fucose-binding lectin II [unclassified Photorhabdus]|uniref:fucose-binding lectin II n=1 Tax=unclassified Photorhabdus TaxID=2620880 RepID=UPI000DCDDD4F|nr:MULTISPECIES: fucose-binding lectin II [unclassified Photorhabdus]RAW97810.1 photopexin B [Photorhabdus sp. S10-54]RAW97891.1 photopexin B [Photorhabdus sp. S9-53]RAX02129.1 photopexin B [Photorhabdus sp. S8-52]